MANEFRFLNLLGANQKPRREKHDGRDYLVVPVVALVEGVVRAMGAKTHELVRAEKFKNAPQAWNGRPIFAGHPVDQGVPISGNDPRILERSFGKVFNTSTDEKRLLMEAWIDIEKAKSMPESARVLERCFAHERGDLNAKPIEVSTGSLVGVKKASGIHHGKNYDGEWDVIMPDHLAMLAENKVGACSVEMGCGALRAATLVEESGEMRSLEGEEEINAALAELQTPEQPKPLMARMMEKVRELAAQLRDLAGKRHNASDEEMIQKVHDHSVDLGASCVAQRNAETHECACRNNHKPGETNMDRSKTIAALAAHPHSAIKDTAMLEKFDDATLKALEDGAAAAKTAAEANEAALKAAKDGQATAEVALKAAQDALAAPVTEERLPQAYRDLMAERNAADAKETGELVTSLKAAQSAYTEDELKAKPLAELRKLAEAFKAVKPSFQGRVVPRAAAAQGRSYAAPDTYDLNKQKAS